MKIGSTSSIALSGLRAAAARLTDSAQNVANVNTSGYVPRGASAPAGPPSGGAAAAARAPNSNSPAEEGSLLSGTDLVNETVEQMNALNAFKANVAVLRTADEMTESLLRVKA